MKKKREKVGAVGSGGDWARMRRGKEVGWWLATPSGCETRLIRALGGGGGQGRN